MRPLLLLSLYCLCSVAVSAQGQPKQETRFAGLDELFQSVLKDWRGAGFAVAVVEKNKVVYIRGFGYRDMEKKLAVTPETLFPIGSCTKAFTASLMGLLRQDGKVEFDKPVNTYLPQFRFFNNELNNSVTLRNMMSHTTGLPRHDLSWYLFGTSSRDSILQRVAYQEPTVGIREKWQYNNFMFALQGMLAEKISGKSWEELTRERLLDPLGMKATNFTISDLSKSHNAALGYELKKDSIISKQDYHAITSMGPAGSINSSVNDMSKWLITWVNGGKFNSKEILPENYVTEAMSSQAIITPQLPTPERPDVFFANYGLGWMLSSYRGHYRVEHGGNIDGFSATTSFFPTDSIGIVVLVNQNGSSIPGIVRNILSDRMLKLSPINWNKELKERADKAKEKQKEIAATARAKKKAGTRTTLTAGEYAGSYEHPGYGTMEVKAKGDSLFLHAGTLSFWLRHFHYDVFELVAIDRSTGIDTSEVAPFKLQFYLNSMGELEKFTLPIESGLKPIEFTRKLKTITTSTSELEKYVGDYEVMGTIAKVSTRNNKLYLFVPGQPEYELAALGKHRFSLTAAEGFFLQFDVSDSNKVTAVTFEQPNGNFKANKK
jgi:CubicO group peptidase (beta-lactamase class C family)